MGSLEKYLGETAPRLEIYYDALQEGKWFRSLDRRLRDAPLRRMEEKGQNIKRVDDLLEYDRPDIVLTYGSKVVMTLEKTEEVPTGHNVGQRFARIVRSSELRVPCVYFFPFVKQKHGKESQEREEEMGKTNQRYVNARLFDSIENLESIHGSLVVPVNWPVDERYELVQTPQRDAQVSSVISGIMDGQVNGGSTGSLRSYQAVKAAKQAAARERETRIGAYPRYLRPPPSVEIKETDAFLTLNGVRGGLREKLSVREKTVAYKIGMRYIRSDPYAGALLVYDYLYARSGRSAKDRLMNVVARMPEITTGKWQKQSEETADRKDIFLFTKFSDAILLKDGVIG